MTVRQRTSEFEPGAGNHEGLSGQARPQRLEGGSGQRRDIAERLVMDLSLLAKAAAQQVRDRLTLFAILRLVLAHYSGDVNRTFLPCHAVIVSDSLTNVTYYLGYTYRPQKDHGCCSADRSGGFTDLTSG